MICDILSTALYKRPSYLVKSRVPLIVAIFRNLLFGLTHVSNQLLYEVTKTKRPSVDLLKVIGLSDMQTRIWTNLHCGLMPELIQHVVWL